MDKNKLDTYSVAINNHKQRVSEWIDEKLYKIYSFGLEVPADKDLEIELKHRIRTDLLLYCSCSDRDNNLDDIINYIYNINKEELFSSIKQQRKQIFKRENIREATQLKNKANNVLTQIENDLKNGNLGYNKERELLCLYSDIKINIQVLESLEEEISETYIILSKLIND